MATRLTDKQHKQILARYVECGNLKQVAREFGVSDTTIKRHIVKDGDTLQKAARKKEENTLDMLKYMDSQKGAAQKLLTNIIIALDNPDKLAKTNPRDLATAYGIIFDKFTQIGPKSSDELLQRAKEILGGIDGVIK